MTSSVEDWLRSLGFIHYTQAFLDNGYDELEICKEIGKEDLDAIGVRNVKDRTDILNAVALLKQAGTTVYFVLEGNDESQHLPAQPERETYPPIQLKMMLRDKLEEDKIDLTCLPYSRPDGTEGNLDTLVTIYADKFYTYEDYVLKALRSLRERQAEQQASIEEPPPQALNAANHLRQSRRSLKYKSRHSQEKEIEDAQGYISEDDPNQRPVFTEDTASPTGIIPPDYLDVDSPAQREKKSREKKRRKVERNTKLSRSLDSLKELHVNIEPKPREREASSFKSKPFRFKWLQGSKKKHHSVGESKKQSLEKRPSNPTTAKDYDLLASAIKMSEEDRMALMIMVKQGELTVEEAVEQLKRYEEDCRKGDYMKPSKDDFQNDDEKSDSKPKLKRGFFGKSTKRKSGSRPSSEVIACEMTMKEEDRINLMRSVKSGELSVDEALKRLISYEEQHKKSDSDDNTVPVKQSPRLPKSVSGFSRISIKRVSGVFSSSSLCPNTVAGEPNSVFYTGEDVENADVGSVDGSVSSGDEVLGTDSSPSPSPKRVLANIQGLNKPSQHSSSSSVDSMEKTDEKSAPSTAQYQQPNFLSEMKAVFEKQPKSEDTEGSEGALHPEQQSIRLGDKPRPPPPTKRTSSPSLETQKGVPSPNYTGVPKRKAPEIPQRSGVAVAQPHRLPPPVPSRPPQWNSSTQGKDNEINNSEVGREAMRPEAEMSSRTSVETQARLEPGKCEQNVVEMKGVALKRANKPPPLPPRPMNTSLNEGQSSVDGSSVENRASPPRSGDTVFLETPAIQVSSTKPYVNDASEKPAMKPQLKPKPKPRPRPRPKMGNSSDNQDNGDEEVPTPPAVDGTSQDNIAQAPDDDDGDAYNEVPPPRPVPASQVNTADSDDDTAYSEVPPPRPVRSSVDEPNKSSMPSTIVRGSSGTARTQGESSGSDMNTSVERKRSDRLAAGGDKLPVPVPRMKRPSHSLGEMVERKLYLEHIDLTQEPYTDQTGCWGVPVNLVDRYAEELHRSHVELAGIMDKLRIRRLAQAQRQAVCCNVSELEFTIDPLGNLQSVADWLTSLGLPMYIKSLAEVEYDDMESMPYMEERHFQFAGISDQRHMRRLLASVEQMPR